MAVPATDYTDLDPAELVAVVGMAGRFPGAPDPESLWRLMMDRVDAIGPVPASRWDASKQLDPEREIQAVGGFIDGVEEFDAGFFGVSPREAAAIDPQQRLLLEVAWQALEDAGQRTADLAGSRTGVYVGASWHDYELLRMERGAQPTPHSLVGNALDVIAARLSYTFKLRGPSMAVETGCSSSLVALHLAAQALRSGEIDAAVVGGTNLILDPHVTVGLTHFGALSPDGRCQAFAASANGFVRGEGVAALVVKTLARALADGDRIHAVVVRTAVNNDGGGDSLVTPSQEGQEDLLRRVYREGPLPGLTPSYIEAHGTGTGRGDPIEVTAIGNVVGRQRTGGPVRIGSVKTNIGHLEASAGLAGLFKLMLSLRHRTVPPSLHSQELNPRIPFDELNVDVVREPFALPESGAVYLGVNSFGWGGTNAHVVVASPPPVAEAPSTAGARTGLPAVLPLSAHHWPALAERADRLAALVPADAADAAALSGALAWRRDHFPVRAAFLADELSVLREALDSLAQASGPDWQSPVAVAGRARAHGRTAFVFPGQGSQWTGMGEQLYRESPLFAEVIERCASALRPHVDWDLLAVFDGTAGDEWSSRIDMLQPVLWAMSLGLAELWRASGVEPDVVLGHSQGEITAATLAGILSYEDAALVMARRSAIARRTSGRGLMLAVDLDREAALAALEGFEDTVALAVHNGPNSSVLSGDKDSVLMLKELLEAEGTYCRLVNVDYASHSPQMDELEEDLLAALAPARPGTSSIALMSTVRGQLLDGPEMDAAYWVENLRQPVQFADAMSALLDDGVTHVVEISPHPVLAPAIEQLTAARPEPAAVLTTLRRHQGSRRDLALALASAYVHGLAPFTELPRHGTALTVPGYPLRPERHWTPERPQGSLSGAARGFEPAFEPAVGEPGTWHGAMELSLADLPWLGDHRVCGTAVLPGAGMLTLAVGTALARGGALPRRLENVAFRKEVALGEHPTRLTAEWQDGLDDQDADGGMFRLLTLPAGGTAWEVNATAQVRQDDGSAPAPGFPQWAEAQDTAVTPAEFYARCTRRGLEYGPAFQGVRTLHLHPDGAEALGEVVLGERLRAGNRPHVLHPALWDSALQVSLALCAGDTPLVPVAVRQLHLVTDPAAPVESVWSHAVRRADGTFDVHLFDADRAPLLSMTGLRLESLPGTGAASSDADRLHHLAWSEVTVQTPAAPPAPARWLVCGGPDARAEALAAALTEAGATAGRADDGFTEPADGVVFLVPAAPDGTEDEPEAGRLALERLTTVVRACTGLGTAPRLAVVTVRGQAAIDSDRPEPGAALAWGFARVLRREHAELASRVVDVDDTEADWAARCAAELLTDDAEDQVALRAGRRLAARLTRGQAPASSALAAGTGPQPFHLVLPAPGRGGQRPSPVVEFQPLTRRLPEAGEVEIAVTAATLHGQSCAGRVTAVGAGVTGLSAGDRVAAWTAGAPTSHVTVRADHALPVPDGLGDAPAAALPRALATAWYALAELGSLGDTDAADGEPAPTVLIRSVPDGVGLAAAQVAGLLGARVIALAGGPGERAAYADLGVAEVLDASEPDWPQAVRAATSGRGADLVLEPRTGSATSAAALAEDGRLISLVGGDGRPGPGGRAPDLPDGTTLCVLDPSRLAARHPERVARLLGTVWPSVADGTVRPLPVREFAFALASEALASPGPGQPVLTDPGTVARIAAVPMPSGRFRADGGYLVTGGLGALGLSLAEFLAANGAGTLVLLGRSAPGPDAAERIAALRTGGTWVEVLSCDVADQAALNEALKGVREQLPPLRGVFHAAGVLSDATIGTLTTAGIDKVLRPKVDGARNLDAVTAEDPLDLFVLFSSAAALIGTAGQAAYASANAYLDALAETRRRRGRPALSIQWGPFSDIGLAAESDGRGARLAERGMGSFPVEDAWPALLRMIHHDQPVTGYVPLNLRQWFDSYPDTAACGSWQSLRAASGQGGHSASADEFLARLRQAAPAEQGPLLEARVRELAGRVLRIDPGGIERETPFKALGLDSLMSLELRNHLESALGLRLSPTLLWAYGTTKALSGALSEQLSFGVADSEPAGPPGD
ncbi:SDR family NAD(P)-dependent oxidoreductase [Kitasatospora sp. NPDC048286]|uniref:SDR family NAD(P)-dependent oxidoreductase n=1 Tax=Kitasatospora sp. NPDC048286 TaxID=3364047 RepID=UPI00371EB3DE